MERSKDSGAAIGSMNRHPPDDDVVEAEITTFDGFWRCQALDTGLSFAQASDIGAPRNIRGAFDAPERCADFPLTLDLRRPRLM
jgi:hypothetical protein